MTADNELTILLTLKDRPLFTFRWMAYANSIRFPFKVLIADGGKDETVPRVLSNKTNFPNLNYEYVRYPYDQTYGEYYSKVADALSRIKTPFVVMADNDDFFIVEGLRDTIEFLCAHSDYSSCGGQIGDFWVTPSDEDSRYNRVYGTQIEYKWCSRTSSVIQETATQRIQSQLFCLLDTYYDVQRTEELKSRFETVRELNLKDLFLVEYLLSFLTAGTGKIKRIDRLYLVRQCNSPDSSAVTHEQKYGDVFGRMLVESWSDDLTKCVNVIAAALAKKDGTPIENARDLVKRCYRPLMAPAIIESLLLEPTVPLLMPIIVRMVRYLIKLGPGSVIRKVFYKLYCNATWIPGGALNGLGFLTYPSPTYRADFKPIHEFLTRQSPSSDL